MIRWILYTNTAYTDAITHLAKYHYSKSTLSSDSASDASETSSRVIIRSWKKPLGGDCFWRYSSYFLQQCPILNYEIFLLIFSKFFNKTVFEMLFGHFVRHFLRQQETSLDDDGIRDKVRLVTRSGCRQSCGYWLCRPIKRETMVTWSGRWQGPAID